MIYLALGDSITHGYDASDEEHRFVTVLTRKLNKVERTSLYMQAKPGWTSAQLLRSLDKVPECVIAEAAIVTLMIGGNDLLKALPWFLDDEEAGNKKLRASFLPTVHAIVEHTKRNPDAVFMICTVYNPFPKSELAQRAISGLNGILREAATAYSCLLVPVDEWYGGEEGTLVNRFKRGKLQDLRLVRNPIHPNDKGHARIADAVFNTYMEIHKQRQAKRGANRQAKRGAKRQAEPQRFRAKRRPHTASQRAERRGGGRSAAARPRSGALSMTQSRTGSVTQSRTGSMTQSRTGRKRIRDKAARQVYN